jgi:hypothetical protein
VIAFAILSLIHAPLPQPDFHTIRHHDAPGEVCPKHDHLLRWHAGASSATDIAVLHWHWFLPTTSGSDSPPLGSGHALHAHLPDWQAEARDNAPQVAPERDSTRLVVKLAASASSPFDLPSITINSLVSPCRATRLPVAFSATFAPRVRFTSRLQRWVC